MKKSYLLGLAITAAALLSVKADIIPTLGSVTPSGGNFQWNYTVNLTIDQTLTSGSYFTIYDFGAPIGATVQPAGWTFSSSLLGTTPGTVLPADDPTVFNLTWTYTGATTMIGPSGLGTFSAVSETSLNRPDNYAGSATKTSNGEPTANIGTVSVPVPEMSALLPMVGVCGFGAIGLASSFLRRRQKP